MNTRQHIAITGWEGTGKSTLTNHVKQHLGFFSLNEMARMIIPLNADLLNQGNNGLSKQTITGYFTAYHLLATNHIMRSIQDRSLLDPLVYDTIYNQNKYLKAQALQEQINRFNEEYQQETILDTLVILKHPKDDEFILKNVFTDQDRLYSQNIKQYKSDALLFEDTMQELALTLSGLCKRVHSLDSYCDNNNITTDVTDIITFSDRRKIAA